ncbi:MAG: SDR family NAD(P)-dependent oxidoreductase [Sphingomonadaceae bacterium]
MVQLEGQVAIVTGAATGMGRAIAVAFGQEGAGVVVNYSKSQREAEATAEMVSQAGGEPLLIQANVARDAEVREMVDRTVDRFGRVDILVNNAGVTVFAPFSDLEAMTDEVWDRIYGVNVKGTFFCSRAVAAPMRRQGSGRIINIASIAGIWPQGSSIAYCASKAAVIHLTKCLARALAPEIRVNAIAPGFIGDTRWLEGHPGFQEDFRKTGDDTLLRRTGTSQDVADAALFLATRGDFITGDILTVDGGKILNC